MCTGKFLVGVIMITIIITATIFMALLITAYKNLENSNFEFVELLGENWSSPPITGLSASRSCPIGHKRFITDAWPGTVAGCKCHYLRRGYCKRHNDYDWWCRDVPAVNPIPFRMYDGEEICIAPSTKYYLDLTVAKGKCPSKTPKKCGVADNLGNYFCVAANLKCPINDLKIISINTPTPDEYSELKLHKKKLIYTNIKVNNPLPIQTKISDGWTTMR